MRKTIYLGLILIILLNLCVHITGGAVSQSLIIHQVDVNKPEITVYFDVGGKELSLDSDSMTIEATLSGETLTHISTETFYNSGEGIWYIFAVDCSTSMQQAQVAAIRECITDIAGFMRENDMISVITFGTQVDTIINLSGDKDEISEAVAEIRADQPGTVFFDALMEVLNLGKIYGDGIPVKREAFVFSDAEDYTYGGNHTRAEIESALNNTDIKINAIGFNNNTKDALDAFGVIARSSGGGIDVVSAATLRDTVMERTIEKTSGYIARFEASSNIVSGSKEALTLNIISTLAGDWSVTIDVLSERWIPDNTPPNIISVEQIASSTIDITFSKQMSNADEISAYSITDKNGNLISIGTVTYDSAIFSSTVTFTEQPLDGEITVSAPGVYDYSMEKNPITDVLTIAYDGFIPTPPPTPLPPIEIPEPVNPAIWLFGALFIVLIIVAIIFGVIRANGGIVRVDGKLRFAGKNKEVVEVDGIADAASYQFVTTKVPELNLRVIDPSGKSKDLSIPVQGSLFVGRASGNDLSFDDPRMSRQHFVIEAKDSGFAITNLSESVGTVLNGVSVKSAQVLQEGDRIEAGNITFLILGGTN